MLYVLLIARPKAPFANVCRITLYSRKTHVKGPAYYIWPKMGRHHAGHHDLQRIL